ncbi:hypothetical protein ACWOEH_06795 [Enterococcus nangangensis]
MKKAIIYLFATLTLLTLAGCSLINGKGKKLPTEAINQTWEVVEATPAKRLDIEDIGGTATTTLFDENMYLGQYKLTQDYDEFLQDVQADKKDVKDLKQFNAVLRKMGYRVSSPDNFYFIVDKTEYVVNCFVLVDGGEKLIALTPFNDLDEQRNNFAILFKKVDTKIKLD